MTYLGQAIAQAKEKLMPTTVIWVSARLTGTIALATLKLIMLGHYYKLVDSSFKARMNRISKTGRAQTIRMSTVAVKVRGATVTPVLYI